MPRRQLLYVVQGEVLLVVGWIPTRRRRAFPPLGRVDAPAAARLGHRRYLVAVDSDGVIDTVHVEGDTRAPYRDPIKFNVVAYAPLRRHRHYFDIGAAQDIFVKPELAKIQHMDQQAVLPHLDKAAANGLDHKVGVERVAVSRHRYVSAIHVDGVGLGFTVRPAIEDAAIGIVVVISEYGHISAAEDVGKDPLSVRRYRTTLAVPAYIDGAATIGDNRQVRIQPNAGGGHRLVGIHVDVVSLPTKI